MIGMEMGVLDLAVERLVSVVGPVVVPVVVLWAEIVCPGPCPYPGSSPLLSIVETVYFNAVKLCDDRI